MQDVIFTDEAKVQSHQNRCRKTYRKHGEPAVKTPKPKHPYSCMVWAGISKRGATDIVIFDGIMKSPFYQTEILGNALHPFIERSYPDTHKFMQDNDPKHTSNSTKQYMQDKGINWWPTPAESPDLNPIEKVWNELKNHTANARTKEELITKIRAFWGGLTPERCTRYINHLHKTIPKVIQQQGAPSGE